MLCIDRKAVVVALLVGPQLAACQGQVSQSKIEPAQIEPIEGSEFSYVTLTEKAIERIDLQTVVVRETQIPGSEGSLVTRKVVPYSALIYDPNGKTWVYVSTEPGKFVRRPAEVERIEGDEAVLLSGPDKDTTVAAIGVAELYGAESGVGH